MQTVLIGTPADNVTITVVRRMHPHAADVHDRNWLGADVKVAIRPWTGDYSAYFEAQDFVRFREAVEQMNTTLEGAAELDPIEPWLWLRLELDVRGHMTLRGKAAPEGNGHVFGEVGLHFTVNENLDQTMLGPLIGQLRAVEEEFPVVGRED